MTQIIQKLADSKDSLRSQSHRAGAVPCKKTGDAADVLDCLGAQERGGVDGVHAIPDGKVLYCKLTVACRKVKRDWLSLLLDEKPRVIAGVHTCLASA